MAFLDILDLRTAIVEEVGDMALIDRFPRLVRLAESGMNKHFRTKMQIKSVTVTVTSGAAVLPSDFLSPISLQDGVGCELVEAESTLANETYKYGKYAVTDTSILAADGTYTLTYYASLPSITGNTTNWLMDRHPEFYHTAVKYEAFKSLSRYDEASLALGEMRRLRGEIRRHDALDRYGDASVENVSE